MKSLVFAGIATIALIVATAPASASDSFTPASPGVAADQLEIAANGAKGGGMKMRGGGMKMRGKGMRMRGGGMRMRGKGMRMHRGKMRGMRMRGNQRPRIIRTGGNRGFGFFGFYQRPFHGFSLPSYWIAPNFGISNYSNFGLSAPQRGYSWSRYYDDAVLRDNRGTVYDYRQNVDWSRGGANYAPNGYYNQQPQQPQNGPAIAADRDAYGWGEETHRGPAPEGTTERGVYDGAWTGQYVDPEKRVYRGEWNGTYTNDQGRTYQGTYRGTATGDPVYRNGIGQTGAPYPQRPDMAPRARVEPGPGFARQPQQGHRPAPQYQRHDTHQRHGAHQRHDAHRTPAGYGRYERCLKGRGIGGGAIGAVIGAVAGNRIGGRGNRLAGSLIGGGIGAISGAVIEKALNKCKKHLPHQDRHVQRPVYPQHHAPQYPAPQTYPAYPQQQQPSGYGWSNGYYWAPGGYYYPPQQTTVTVIPGTTTTTTVTEEVYETTYVSRPAGKRRIKPKGKRLRKPGCRC
ncbi:MAG: RcnB family protein [Sphingorhabdus sp.]